MGQAIRDLNGKCVVITGAASGIGRALAMEFASHGARLLLADIDSARLQGLAAELASRGCDCATRVTDTGREDEIQALAAQSAEYFGAADILVNNAGVTLIAPVDAMSSADAQWLININFWGVVHGCRAFLPQLRTRPAACIVNLSSIFGMISVPTQSMYAAAKAAVRAFSDSLRSELRVQPADQGINVLCVHPGGIRTSIARNARVTDSSMVADSPQALVRGFEELARLTPEDAARAIVGAVRAGRTRLLIGGDALVFDWMWRLAPARAAWWAFRLGQFMRRRLARRLAAGEESA